MNSLRHKIRVSFVAVLLAMTAVLAYAAPVFALDTGLDSTFQEATGLGNTDARIIIAQVINAALGLLGIIAVSLIVYSGFLWMTAAGSPDRVKKAKAVMINAIIGLMIILSSYAITTYVLNKLTEATGYVGGLSDDGQGTSTFGSSSSVFTVSGASPQGTQTIKNLTVRLTFNKEVDETTVDDAITITASGASAPVDGTFTVSGRRVNFRPDALCEGYTDVYCFDADTAYTIEIDKTLMSTSGLSLSCGGLYDACSYDFTSGSLIDAEDPVVEVTYPDNGDSIEENTTVELQATVTDDAGISLIEFYIDGELIGEDQPTGSSPMSYTAAVDWDNASATTGQSYDIYAIAYDVDDNNATADSVRVTVRAAHCFNGDYPMADASFPDEDEEGEDCGGADCASCSGEACDSDADCASGVCEGGYCVDYPEITGMSPGNGAIGSYVTISGNNFGSTPGDVHFGTTQASFADCDDPWDTDQIIVAVPVGLTTDQEYEITVTTADGYSDTNQDDNGSLVNNFEVNSTVRPGICQIDPEEDIAGTIISVQGTNFEDAQGDSSAAYFDSTEVGAYNRWDDDELRVTVPTVAVGAYEVRVEVDGVSSNEVSFEVLDPDADDLPTIALVDPDTGPVGEYITISGSGFGSTIGEVYFVNTDLDSGSLDTEILADVVFPAVCEDNYWQRDQIIVKVPSGVDTAAEDFEVYVERADDEVSNAVAFTLTTGEASPGICAVEPDAGPAGYVGVTIYGEGFGPDDEEGSVVFYASDADNMTSATVTSWNDEEAAVNVPSDALSGPITLFDLDANDSNQVNFDVGDCNQDADLCDATTQQCCSSGACVASGDTCPEDAAAIEAHYAWVFSTGTIPEIPEVLYVCSDEAISPTPWDGRAEANGESVCVNAVVSATFDLVMDQDTMDASSILLEKCIGTDATDPCISTSSVVFSSISTTSTGFTAIPVTDFSVSSTYQVTLTTDIESYNGDPIEETVWTFGTAANAALCDIGSVLVTPSTEEITTQYGTANFVVQAVAEDACVILNSDAYTWTWATDGTYADLGTATVACAGTPSSCQIIEGNQETPAANPTYVLAEEGGTGLDDTADLTINFTDPYVVDQWPDCSTACINAAIIVEFNTAMDTATFTSGTGLYECIDEYCETFVSSSGVSGTVAWSTDSTELTFTPSAYLSANTYYRAVLSGEIASTSGVTLQDSAAITLNYNNDDDYSWTFKTRNDTAACEIERVDMDPPSAIVDMVGQMVVFEAQPYGPADDCSVSGQPLTATVYDWTWAVANTLVATLWSDGDVDVASDEIPEGCTSACTATGTESYIGICGQDADGVGGLLDTGEDCDDGNETGGDGCSATCQNEGTSACASTTSASCCGNATLDTGEECDDGAATSGDGCSSTCLNEGSRQAGTTCNDLIVTPDPTTSPLGGGEDCDDGNTVSGDGCSSECLNEGTSVYADLPGICGNNILESPAEECDDDNTIDGDGCSSTCLAEGETACADPTGDLLCCGNGIEENDSKGAGETCDDGNATSGDGCSSTCLFEGSSRDYSTPSFCGDVEVGLGEDLLCEVSSSDLDGRVEPIQITVVAETAPAQVSATTHIASTDVTAEAEGEKGSAEFVLSCSCEVDSDCSDSVTGGCGANGCCYDRPDVLTPAPTMTDACRNAAIYVEFDQAMDVTSFEDNATVTLTLNGTDICPYPSTTARTDGFFGRVWHGIVRVFQFLVRPLFAQSTTCELPVTFHAQESSLGQKVYFIYDELLEEDGQYVVSLSGDPLQTGAGVRSENGVGMATNYAFGVDIGDDYCLLEEIVVTDTDADSPNYFSTTSEEHDYTAVAYSNVNGEDQELQALAGVYEWTWGTWISGTSGFTLSSAPWTVSETTIFSIDSSADTEGDDAVMTALGLNGASEVIVTATITEDTLFNPSTEGDIVTGTTSSTAFLCENPWPALAAFPFEDSSTAASADPDGDGVSEIAALTAYMNFSTYYCRDAGADGSTEDYDALDAVGVTDPPGDVLKEYLFEVVGGDDVIGIRTVPNEDLYSISRWYDDQGFTGSPSETTIDGYEALVDGRTTYVSVASVSDTGSIYATIYAISYNANADQETIIIYEQLLENLSFNTNLTNTGLCYEEDTDSDPSNDVLYTDTTSSTVECSSNLDCTATGNCHADKDKLTRDLLRLTDLRDIEIALDDYGTDNGRCSATTTTSCMSDDDCSGSETCEELFPELDSGTFLRAYATSPWDSWGTQFEEALSTSLPIDPLNRFDQCGTSPYEEYAAETCWNATEAQFVCPEGSHTYLYRNIGGTAYLLATDLEYAYVSGTSEWAYDLDQNLTDDLEVIAGAAFTSSAVDGYQSVAHCAGAVMGTSESCGDGVIGALESCEIGETSESTCTVSTCISADADYDGLSCDDVDCTDTTICSSVDTMTSGTQITRCNDTCSAYETATDAACVPLRCGNGVQEGIEECDDGSHNGEYGYCGESCTVASGFYCGDSTLAGGERCDLGSLNGVYATNAASTCSSTCDGYGPYCGDAEINGTEECDGEGEKTEGGLCRDTVTTCNMGTTCSDGYACGSGGVNYVGCPVAHICRGGTLDGAPCDIINWPGISTSAWKYYEDAYFNATRCETYGGVCTDQNEYQTVHTRSCDDAGSSATCQFAAWTTCYAGEQYCGNGEEEGTEECDDGDTDNNDSCTTECTVNVCGDGYLHTGYETCDEASKNGTLCDAGFGETCRYCSVTCNYLTASGDYCGDGALDDDKEYCDGSLFSRYRCYAGVGDIDEACETIGATTSECASGYTCREVGACNGGHYTGEYCYNDAACGTGYDCVMPVCADDCASSCPHTYSTTGVNITSEEAGASPQSGLTLYANNSGNFPDEATLTIPACLVSQSLSVDIRSDDTYSLPNAAVMFVMDISADTSPADLTTLADAAEAAAEILFDSYSGSSSTLQVGFATIGGRHGDDTNGDKSYVSTELYDFVDDANEDGVAYGYGLTDSESSFLAEFTTALSYNYSTTGVPIYKSLEDAYNELPSGSDTQKVILLFSTGSLSNSDLEELFALKSSFDEDADGSLEDNEYLLLVASVATTAKEDDVRIFTIGLTGDADSLGYLSHLSSDECGTDEPSTEDGTCSLGLGETCDADADCYTGECSAGSSVQYCNSIEDCNPGAERYCVDESITDPSGGTCDEDSDCYGVCNGGTSLYANCEEYNSGVNTTCDLGSISEGTCAGETVAVIDDPTTTGTDESEAAVPGTCSNSADTCFSDLDCIISSTSPGTCSTSGMCSAISYTYVCDDFDTVQTCDLPEDPYADETDCEGPYSLSTDSVDELAELFSGVVEMIANPTVTITDKLGNSATTSIMVGDGISISLPDAFVCDPLEETFVGFQVNFLGEGSIEFENFSLNFCAP